MNNKDLLSSESEDGLGESRKGLSWLNLIECEFSALSPQCLNRRFADMKTVRKEIDAWNQQENNLLRLSSGDLQLRTHG